MSEITINISSGSHFVTKIDCGSSSPYVGGAVDLSQFIFLTEFNGGDNDLSSLEGISAIPTLSKIEITGENTVGFNLSELSAPLSYLDIQGSNTIAGNVGDLPTSLQFLRITGDTTVSGSVGSFPAGINHIEIEGNNTISGNIAGIPSSASYVQIGGNNEISGNFNDVNCPNCLHLSIRGNDHTLQGNTDNLPPVITYVSISTGKTSSLGIRGNVGGDTQNIPNTVTTYINNTEGVVVGDLGSLPTSLEVLEIDGGSTRSTTTGNIISGNISVLPRTLKHFELRGRNTTTGNLFDLPPGITHYANSGFNTANRYYDGTVTGTGLRQWAPNMSFFLMFPSAPFDTPLMPVGEFVTLLIDLSLTSWVEDPSDPSSPLIQVSGASNPVINLTTYPEALAAILSLRAQGVTVLVRTTGGPPV